MKYVRLGNSGLKVSQVILGCMTYGTPDWLPWVLEYDSALPILKAAYESGVTTWDTADMYSNGESERVVGRAMKELKIPRSDIVIMTKAFFPTMDGLPAELKTDEDEKNRQRNLNKGGLSRAALFHAVDASLQRLQTDYIDVLQIHRLDDTPFAEVMKALHDLVQSGKVRYIGASSMWCHEFVQMQAIARQNGWTEFVSMQNEHNLLYREEEREMNRYCKKTGVALIPWGPLAAGALTRPVSQTYGTTMRADQIKDQMEGHAKNQADIETISRVEVVAREKGWTMAQVAFAWSASKVTAPIVGISKVERLREFVSAVELRLPDEDIEYLEAPYQPKPVQGFQQDRATS